jgi:hypothetical protein
MPKTKRTPAATASAAKKAVKKTPKVEKKVDVVEEVKRELRTETTKTSACASSCNCKKGIFSSFSWGILIAVLIIIFGGQWLLRQIRVQSIRAQLPELIEELGGGMTLVDLRDWRFRGGVWEFTIVFEFGGEETEFTSYISEDGRTLFTSGIDVAEFRRELEMSGGMAGNNMAEAATCETISQVPLAHIDAYVVADCPFAVQMQRAIYTAITEAPELANFVTVRYIGDIIDGQILSMNGEREAQENLRQICIREEQSALYWPYVACYMRAGDSEGCLVEAGVNAAALNTCMTDGTGLAHAQVDFDMSSAFAITGTPTLVVNDFERVSEFNFGGRSADAIREIICCSSTERPDFCDLTLTTDQATVSFSDQLTQGSAASNTSTCGQV